MNHYEEIAYPELSVKFDFLVEYRGERDYIVIPEGIRVLEPDSFAYDDRLKGVILPKSLQYIKKSAFSSCYKLEEIHIPDTVIEIEDSAFSYCKKLKKVTYSPEKIKIGKNCFDKCPYLDENGQTLPHKEEKKVKKEEGYFDRIGAMKLEELGENEDDLLSYFFHKRDSLLENQDTETYLRLLNMGIEKNIGYFLYTMAIHYLDGDIVEKNTEKYLYFIEKAVEQGYVSAFYFKYYAIRFEDYKSEDDWYTVLKEGAFLGSAACQKTMFHCLSNGNTYIPHPKAAGFWVKQAVKNSYGEKMMENCALLSDCYIEGFGVVRDIPKALTLAHLSLKEGEKAEEDYLVKKCYETAEQCHISLEK